jgi:hypothetical protein
MDRFYERTQGSDEKSQDSWISDEYIQEGMEIEADSSFDAKKEKIFGEVIETESLDIPVIHQTTKDLQHFITSRLTALAYVTGKISPNKQSPYEERNKAETEKSEECQIGKKKMQQNNSTIDVKQLLAKMLKLHEEYLKSKQKLDAANSEAQLAQTEESQLMSKLEKIESFLKKKAHRLHEKDSMPTKCCVF